MVTLYKKSEILNKQFDCLEKILISQDGGLENIPNRGLRLYPIKAVILIGMILTNCHS